MKTWRSEKMRKKWKKKKNIKTGEKVKREKVKK